MWLCHEFEGKIVPSVNRRAERGDFFLSFSNNLSDFTIKYLFYIMKIERNFRKNIKLINNSI